MRSLFNESEEWTDEVLASEDKIRILYRGRFLADTETMDCKLHSEETI